MTNHLKEIFWVNLIAEINAGQCILIIGPDLVSFENSQTLFQLLYQQLEHDEMFKDLVNSSPHIFKAEELIQPKADVNDSWLYEFYRKFYAKRSEFDEPFLKIAQIPFHLVISLLPDERLTGIFNKIGRQNRFSYYPCSEDVQKPEEVERPSKDKPLVYNILGTVGTPENPKLECVITFDHLFTYLQGVLSDNRSLPIELAKKLLTAKTVLFLGVHFERWYMQILLRVLLPKNASASRKFSMQRGNANSDVSIFITKRLALEFLSIEPIKFLDELYERCNKNKLLVQKKRKVFISYSHGDKETVDQISERFRQAEITVIRDEESMSAGEKIRDFIERELEVDAVVVVVSKNSLKSPWVSEEVINCIDKGIELLPCYLNKQFLNKQFLAPIITGKIEAYINKKLIKIECQISERLQANSLDTLIDLTNAKTHWEHMRKNLPMLINEIKARKGILLDQSNTEAGIKQMLAAIQSSH